MTDPISTPAQMREAAARCCEAEADKCDDAAKWGGSKRYVSDCKAAAYAMLDRAAAIRALPVAEPAPVAVRVKPLEWACVHTYAQDVFDAIGVGMVYRIIPQDGHFWLTVPAVDNKYPTIDAAKDAANADNEARVLSQIDAVPAAQVRAEALEEADYFGSLVLKARTAATKASIKFPQPNYVTLKIAEEAGEVVRGAVHYAEGRMEWAEVEGEIVQLLAMLIRFVTEGDEINGVIPPVAIRALMEKPE